LKGKLEQEGINLKGEERESDESSNKEEKAHVHMSEEEKKA